MKMAMNDKFSAIEAEAIVEMLGDMPEKGRSARREARSERPQGQRRCCQRLRADDG